MANRNFKTDLEYMTPVQATRSFLRRGNPASRTLLWSANFVDSWSTHTPKIDLGADPP